VITWRCSSSLPATSSKAEVTTIWRDSKHLSSSIRTCVSVSQLHSAAVFLTILRELKHKFEIQGCKQFTGWTTGTAHRKWHYRAQSLSCSDFHRSYIAIPAILSTHTFSLNSVHSLWMYQTNLRWTRMWVNALTTSLKVRSRLFDPQFGQLGRSDFSTSSKSLCPLQREEETTRELGDQMSFLTSRNTGTILIHISMITAWLASGTLEMCQNSERSPMKWQVRRNEDWLTSDTFHLCVK
jgi:hypothetical protein